MQIKTMMRYQLTPVRMSVIKRKKEKCSQGFREKGTLVHAKWNKPDKKRKGMYGTTYKWNLKKKIV